MASAGIPEPQKPRALVYGRTASLLEAVPALLSRAGFSVTLVTTAKELRRCLFVDRFILAADFAELQSRALAEARTGFALVVAGDDRTLHQVMRSPLPESDKLLLLPVSSAAGLAHIGSKIGLSETLSRAGVPTPAFAVARNREELAQRVIEVGLPVMLKADFGNSGELVFECRDLAQLDDLPPQLHFPILVQKKIDGALRDYSGFFHNGELVSFGDANHLHQDDGSFAPSSVRLYRTNPYADPAGAEAVRALGRALSANGFVNISAMRDADGQTYFFEADMRPNVWIEFAKYYGADPAVRIAKAFGLPPPPEATTGPLPAEIVLSYLPRLKLWEVLVNRYRCWSFFPNYARRCILCDLIRARLGQVSFRRLRDWLSTRRFSRG